MIKNKNLGFTIIEVMIAISIASLISLTLYQMLTQASKSVTRINLLIDSDLPILPFYNQLELDITGMFSPKSTVNFYIEKFKEKKEENKEKEKKVEENKENNKKNNKEEDKEKEKNKKDFIKDIFYLKTLDSGDLIISFITTSGIKYLDFDGSLKPSSFIYRVAYILRKNIKEPNTFELIYKCDDSSKLLDVKDILDTKFENSYKLISRIKDLKIKLIIYEFVKSESDKEDKKNEPKNITLTNWQEEEIFKKYKALIPAYVSFQGIILTNNNIENQFNFEFKVPSYTAYI